MSNAGRQLAKMRQRGDRVCEVCARTFKGLKTAHYCSIRCRNTAAMRRYRAKHRT